MEILAAIKKCLILVIIRKKVRAFFEGVFSIKEQFGSLQIVLL